MVRIALFAALGLCILGAACGGPPGPASRQAGSEGQPAEDASLPMADPVDPAIAASITGTVAFLGQAPPRRPISMDAIPSCARQHATPPLSEEVIVNENGTLANVFIWIKDGLPARRWPAPDFAVQLDQKACIYTPHVVGLMVGQTLEILNSDPTNHNVHPLPRSNREWNESQPPRAEPKRKRFPIPEVMIPFKCNVHPWMRAYVGVVAHPYFAVTGSRGDFALRNLPAGEYTVQAWHERYGTQELKVKLGPKESKTADFAFKG